MDVMRLAYTQLHVQGAKYAARVVYTSRKYLSQDDTKTTLGLLLFVRTNFSNLENIA